MNQFLRMKGKIIPIKFFGNISVPGVWETKYIFWRAYSMFTAACLASILH